MSEITITDKLVDKLTEAINKSVKKTNVFEKIEKNRNHRYRFWVIYVIYWRYNNL
jgi:hypothetical protein